MEIRFLPHNKVDILGATKAELESLLKFCSNLDTIKATEEKTVATPEQNEDGLTIPEIARRLGRCHQTIEYRIKKYNIQPLRVSESGWKYYDFEVIKANFEDNPINSSKSKGAKASVVARKSSTPFAQWSTEQRTKCKTKGKDVGKTFSEVFRVMSKDYGIVWDQVKKDFFATNKRSANSTVELCYFLQYEQEHNADEHYENLFENQLDKLLA